MILTPENWIENHLKDMSQDLSELLTFASVAHKDDSGYPFGRECKLCADKLMEIGEKHGFKVENNDYYCVSLIIPGESEQEIAILGHMDIVPEGEGWSYPPYAATRDGDYIIARGSSDNKGPSVMSVYALKYIMDNLPTPKKTLRFIAGFNEESGMEDVKHYVKTHDLLPEFTIICDGMWPAIVGEKGMLQTTLYCEIEDENLLSVSGGVATNSVPDTATALIKRLDVQDIEMISRRDIKVCKKDDGYHLTANGIAAHAAFADNSVNAIGVLTNVLKDCTGLCANTRAIMANLSKILCRIDGEALGIAGKDDISGATSCVGGVIALNGTTLSQTIDVRYNVSTEMEKIENIFRKKSAELGFEIKEIKNIQPRYTNPNDKIPSMLINMANEHFNMDSEPIVMGGGTHAKFFPNSLPYGPGFKSEDSPFDPSPFGGAHGANEAVNIKSLAYSLPLYVKALQKLCEL